MDDEISMYPPLGGPEPEPVSRPDSTSSLASLAHLSSISALATADGVAPLDGSPQARLIISSALSTSLNRHTTCSNMSNTSSSSSSSNNHNSNRHNSNRHNSNSNISRINSKSNSSSSNINSNSNSRCHISNWIRASLTPPLLHIPFSPLLFGPRMMPAW
ncbi:uncharacterized protein VDAG_09010 [Verticillium dahliae VdLs.17]|uniref:Uncharacterized protein n=1 Tax=Verticillium dahliae (strain VdLs.17 / ATCC MYA-4575 / FGSC 10137) TaxID=498257 RepID=G2XG31_VERDV|nr:uncharacterized protein VDAG_09010 [Verticillium dahliae VdLs.17]EGY18850.1 hypothetical protein VDAG_09010 [Verticillium dahliae VdLs.17]